MLPLYFILLSLIAGFLYVGFWIGILVIVSLVSKLLDLFLNSNLFKREVKIVTDDPLEKLIFEQATIVQNVLTKCYEVKKAQPVIIAENMTKMTPADYITNKDNYENITVTKVRYTEYEAEAFGEWVFAQRKELSERR